MNNSDDKHSNSEQQLQQEQLARAELEREVTLLHQFISRAGHDLRTPLSTLKTSLYLMQRKPEMATSERFEMMESQLTRLSRLVDAMSLMSRLDDKSELVFDENDVTVVINEALWAIDDRLKASQINIILDAPSEIASVNLNFEEFKRALINLLDNAIRYTAQGGDIAIHLFEMHGYLCVDVIDTGRGLSETEISHLFERFYRGDDSVNDLDIGAGMGLAIVKRIMELHDGKIRVISEQTVRTVFRLMLPV